MRRDEQPPRGDEVKARLLPADPGLYFVCFLRPHRHGAIRTIGQPVQRTGREQKCIKENSARERGCRNL